MAASDNSIGILILGNSGVGKSYLGNVILGREVFKHEYQCTAVTVNTEYQKSSFNKQTYAIYNIPGLIEADQERIDLNKREINVAFQQHPNAVVLYVFGTNNGRIRNEDVVAFNALNEAYPFSQKSLVVIVNNVNPNRPKDYEAETRTALSSLLKMHLPHLCFVMEIRQASEKNPLREQLEKIITSAMPTIHSKMQEINLQAAEISKLTKQIAEFQKQIAQDREEHRLQVENLEKEFEERERRQRAEQEARERQLRTEMETKEQQQRAEQAEKERRQEAKQDEFRRKVEKEQEKAKEERKKLEDELKENNAALDKAKRAPPAVRPVARHAVLNPAYASTSLIGTRPYIQQQPYTQQQPYIQEQPNIQQGSNKTKWICGIISVLIVSAILGNYIRAVYHL